VLFNFQGDTVDKIGRTTGWTYGPVISACALVQLFDRGTNYRYMCTNSVNADADVGDSGAGVFVYSVSGDTASVSGQLLGGDSTTVYYYSPMNNIQGEMGLLISTIYGWF
jgi:hypothetical protein